jgi:hypothetical protein
MPRKLRVLGVVTGAASALYLLGVWLMSVTPAPWGLAWVIPLALLGGAACRMVERPGERRELRRASGHCERCAYDLRATPYRCPECGRRTW